MALTFSLNAGFVFSEVAAETITASKLNRMISEGFVASTSGTIETGNIGDLQVTAAKLAVDSVETAKIKALAVTQAKIATNSLTGTVVGDLADSSVIGGIPVIHKVPVSAAGDTTIALTHKTLITDVWCVKTSAGSAGGDTITIKNVATAITDVMVLNVADKIIVRALEIDDAQDTIAAGANLVITAAEVGAVDCVVYIQGVRVA